MSPQEESRIYAEMNTINTKLDVLMPLVTETRSIEKHLATLNGSVQRQGESINRHDNQFASITTQMTNFFADAQEIKMMNLPRMIERVDWLYRFFWIMAGATLTSLIGVVFTFITK